MSPGCGTCRQAVADDRPRKHPPRRRIGRQPHLRALLTSAVLLLVSASGTSHENQAARGFLAMSLGLTSAELARIDAGHVVARTIDVSDKREVATVGVVRVRITPEFYVQQLADIANFKRDEAILQIGTFGNPPDLADVAHLTLDDSDIRTLRACRVGNCGVQLSAAAISRFGQEVDWRRADARQRANGLMRQILIEYVTEYRRSGAAASMEYADQSEPVNLEREFASLAESDVGAWKYFPALRRHLVEYPDTSTTGTTDLLYWSKEKVWRRGVASVTHLAICRPEGDSPADYAVASKQIYGSHYYVASLGLTVLLRDRAQSSPATYVGYVNRSRVDVFGGLFGGVTRSVVSGRARATVSEQLARLQRTLEQRFAGSPAAAVPPE